MAHVLIMPRQGNTVESCIVQEWKVQEGDKVKADTAVCVVETDKANFEIPAGADGQILKILHSDGEDVPVLKPIAVIGAAGEDWKSALGAVSEEAAGKAASAIHEKTKNAAPVSDVSANLIISEQSESTLTSVSPRARNLAARKGILPESIPGSGPGGRVLERDIKAALAGRPPLTAAALAAVASGRTAPMTGTGVGGRITSADIASGVAAAGTGIVKTTMTMPVITDEGAVTETPIRNMRKVVSGRMFVSPSERAQFTLNADASAVQLRKLRKQIKNAGENIDSELAGITINDLVLFAVSRTLSSYSYMNAHKIGDIIKTYERVHLGMAVDTPQGLMVPVIRNASLLSLRHISAEARRLAAACRDGTIKSDELSGSTFTVSNLGNYGISSFTPMLNLPEVASLGVCNIELKPVEKGDNDSALVFEPRIGFSLTINYQVVDGTLAVRFFQAFCRAVADINLLLAVG